MMLCGDHHLLRMSNVVASWNLCELRKMVVNVAIYEI